ncbi:MAG: hypothetical protein ABJC09_16835 [Terriglobia bacterium]
MARETPPEREAEGTVIEVRAAVSTSAPLYYIECLNHTQRVYDLTEGMIRRGYTDAHIRLVPGDNSQRALSEIWT